MKGSEVGYNAEAHKGQGPQGLKITIGMLVAAWNNMDADHFNKMTALSKTVFCKKLESLAEQLREDLIPMANKEWQAEYARVTASGSKIVMWDGASLKKNSGRAKWEYPKNITDMEDRLKQAKKVAEADGSAKNIAVRDPLVDAMFSITV